MKQNVGGIDRVARLILGLGIIAAGVYYQSWWGAIGVVPLLTGGSGFCPAYLPIGFSTAGSCCGCAKDDGEKKTAA